VVNIHVTPHHDGIFKFVHHVGGKREQRNKNQNDTSFDYTKSPEYVCLPPPPFDEPPQVHLGGGDEEDNNGGGVWRSKIRKRAKSCMYPRAFKMRPTLSIR
jgi:hypothetical protein